MTTRTSPTSTRRCAGGAFNLQVYFLSSRFKHQHAIEAAPHSVVQDRSIYEDAEIFARNLFEMGLMAERDYDSYRELFAIMTGYLRAPDLLVYLRASVPTLVQHIQTRGRAYETGIRIDYLERLNTHYEDWIARYSLGPKAHHRRGRVRLRQPRRGPHGPHWADRRASLWVVSGVSLFEVNGGMDERVNGWEFGSVGSLGILGA